MKQRILKFFLSVITFCSASCGPNEYTQKLRDAVDQLCACTRKECGLNALKKIDDTHKEHTGSSIKKKDRAVIKKRIDDCQARLKNGPPQEVNGR